MNCRPIDPNWGLEPLGDTLQILNDQFMRNRSHQFDNFSPDPNSPLSFSEGCYFHGVCARSHDVGMTTKKWWHFGRRMEKKNRKFVGVFGLGCTFKKAWYWSNNYRPIDRINVIRYCLAKVTQTEDRLHSSFSSSSSLYPLIQESFGLPPRLISPARSFVTSICDLN